MKHLILGLLFLAALACAPTTPSGTIAPGTSVAVSGTTQSGATVTGWDTQTKMGQPLAGERGAVIEASVLVEKVDLKNRTLTVKKPNGTILTLKVGTEVKRLNEIKPGDTVVAQFISAVAYELRAPTAEEQAAPAAAVVAAGRNDKSLPPGAAAANTIHTIVTIEEIDRKAGTVTIMGPSGETTVLNVERPENFQRIKVGDKLAVTYVEAVALKVEPRKG